MGSPPSRPANQPVARSKVDDLHRTLGAQDQVLRLDVQVDDVSSVYVVQPAEDVFQVAPRKSRIVVALLCNGCS